MTDIEERLLAQTEGGNLLLLREAANEIKRLKMGMKEYACTATEHPCGCYDQFLSERAEIERLQRHIYTLEGMLGEMNIAVPECAALERKP